MGDINELVLERLIHQAQIHLPMVEVKKEGLLNASQIMKAKPTFKYDDTLIEITEGQFSMTIGAHSIFYVLFQWESMMNARHYRFEVGEHREYKKFWCSTKGVDGKASINKYELVRIQDNIWCREGASCHYDIFVNICKDVAVLVGDSAHMDISNLPEYLTDAAKDFKSFLLTKCPNIPIYIFETYLRLKDYDTVTKMAPLMAQQAERRKEEDRIREERRKEEARMEAERMKYEAEQRELAKQREAERLAEEMTKFINGEKVSGIDLVTLCAMNGIELHPKTVHNLKECVIGIDKDGCCNFKFRKVWRGGKYVTAKPNLDGCFEASEKLYGCLA